MLSALQVSAAPHLVEVGSYIELDLGNVTSNATGSNLLKPLLKPKTKNVPTYKYAGCYAVQNSETEFMRPGPAGTATALHGEAKVMTVQKCFEWCHEQKVRAGRNAQFFLL